MNESTISMMLGAVVIIIVGLLVVNYFKGLDTGTTLPSIESEDLGAITLPTTHTVTDGEDLWKIAEKYYKSGYNWVDIANANNLEAPYVLEVGQVLDIPDAEIKLVKQDEDVATPTVIAMKEETESPTIQKDLSIAEVNKLTDTSSEATTAVNGDTYTVVHGDTLWSIAERAYADGYKWVEIAKANDLVNPSVIHAGNIFTLPR